MPELDPELLTALRNHRSPPEGARARVHARLEATLLGPPPSEGGSGLDQAGGGAPALGHGGGVFVAKIVAATTALTTAGLLALKLGAVVLANPTPEPRAELAVVEREPTQPATVDPISEAAPVPPSPTELDSPIPANQPIERVEHGLGSNPTPASPSVPIASIQPATELDVEAELALIANARRAPNSAAAIELLRDHAKRFPEGTLRDEREALWAIASCAREDFSDARERRDALLARRPSSPLLDRIAKACPTLEN